MKGSKMNPKNQILGGILDIIYYLGTILCELGMKPLMHPLYHVIVRPTKIIKDLIKDFKILIFKVLKINEIFLNSFLGKRDQLF